MVSFRGLTIPRQAVKRLIRVSTRFTCDGVVSAAFDWLESVEETIVRGTRCKLPLSAVVRQGAMLRRNKHMRELAGNEVTPLTAGWPKEVAVSRRSHCHGHNGHEPINLAEVLKPFK